MILEYSLIRLKNRGDRLQRGIAINCKILSPWLGEIVDSGIGCRTGPPAYVAYVTRLYPPSQGLRSFLRSGPLNFCCHRKKKERGRGKKDAVIVRRGEGARAKQIRQQKCLSFFPFIPTTVCTRETREGWPLLTAETEATWDWRIYKRSSSMSIG